MTGRLVLSTGIGVSTLMATALVGCTPSNTVAPGPPIMMSFSVVDPTGAPIELETEAGPTTVPPLSHFVATFDRLLDPTPLAKLGEDGGPPEPKAGVALIDWSGGAVESTSLYSPNGHHKFTLYLPPGPSLTTTPSRGLPSATLVAIMLDPAKVRSHDQKSAYKADEGVKATLMFTTDLLVATVDVPAPEPSDASSGEDGPGNDGGTGPGMAPPVDARFVAHVTFNNFTSATTATSIQVSATVSGAPVAAPGAVVAQDAPNGTSWTVSPPSTGWPAGAVVTITIDATAADTFGMTTGVATSASFAVKL